MVKKCFVISPIGLEGTETRARSDQIFSFVIKPAVELLGYEAIRGDQIHQPGMISSQTHDIILLFLIYLEVRKKTQLLYLYDPKHQKKSVSLHRYLSMQVTPLSILMEKWPKTKVHLLSPHLLEI